MRIPLIRGRVWSDSESAGTPHVAVVNQTMARELWPDESAIGRRVRMPEYIRSTSYWRLPAPGSDGWFEIIGVVGDTPNVGLHERPAPSIYVPYTLMLSDTQYLILRTSRDPLSMTRSIREAVRTVDPNQPVNAIRTAESALADAGWARERFVTLLLLGFAAFRADARSSRALQCRVVLGVVPIQRIWHPYGARCRSRAHRTALRCSRRSWPSSRASSLVSH